MFRAWAPAHSGAAEVLCRSKALHFRTAQWQTEARLCRYHYRPTKCLDGAACPFAHGLEMLRKPDDDLLHKSDWPYGDWTSSAFQQAVEMEVMQGGLPERWQAYASTAKSSASSSFDRPKDSQSKDDLPKPEEKADVGVGDGGGQGTNFPRGDLPEAGPPHEFKPLQEHNVRPDGALSLAVLPVWSGCMQLVPHLVFDSA